MSNAIDCLVIHHNDNDGKCAAAVVGYFEVRDCTYYSINYGYDIPWNLIKRAEKVYMVDFCLQPFKEMIKLLEMKGDNFIWIDHHKTSIADEALSGRKFKGVREVGKAGCELAWQHFTHDEMPKIVEMFGRYDVWDLTLGDDLFSLHTGTFLYDLDPINTQFWTRLLEDDMLLYDQILEKGKICMEYQSNRNEAYCKSHSFDLEWEGYRFLVLNALNVNSRTFDAKFNHNEYDAVMAFGYTNKNWSFSMYTDKPGVDVGSLARKKGGGGHTGAAGFQLTEFPFTLEMKKGS